MNAWSWEVGNHLQCRVFSILTQPTCSCRPANCSTEHCVYITNCMYVCLEESFSVWEKCRGDQRTNTSTRLVCALGKCLHHTSSAQHLHWGLRRGITRSVGVQSHFSSHFSYFMYFFFAKTCKMCFHRSIGNPFFIFHWIAGLKKRNPHIKYVWLFSTRD